MFYGEGICHHCGQSWFMLIGDGGEPGLVCIDERGAITGHSSKFKCVECGEIWEPYVSHLRLVKDDE